MKRKFWAFSTTLVLLMLLLFGPRHPGGDLPLNPALSFHRPDGTVLRTVRQEAAAAMVGTRYRLKGFWPGNCGDELLIEDQLNCAIYLLNHPGQWLGR
jgi:hypothetical protein